MAINDMGPLQDIVNVHWRSRARYFLFFSAGVDQSWDGGGPVEGSTFSFASVSSPFSDMDFIGFADPFSPGPISQLTFPSGFSGVVSDRANAGHGTPEPSLIYEHSISLAALRNDNLVQAVWSQYDNRLDVGPGHDHTFSWQVNQDAYFNLNLVDVGDSVTMIVSQSGNGNNTLTAFIARMRTTFDGYADPQDLGTLDTSEFNLDGAFGPFANLVATDADEWDLTVTRLPGDIWEFSSTKVNAPPENNPGWFIDNTPFP